MRRMHSDAMKILEAAERRFAHYGYGKTTMAEIAQDADMSVGNLYRFFRNKEAIALAGTERLLSAKLDAGLRRQHRNHRAVALCGLSFWPGCVWHMLILRITATWLN